MAGGGQRPGVKGWGRGDEGQYPETAMKDMRPAIKDWGDTAAIMSQLDMVISVDTAWYIWPGR